MKTRRASHRTSQEKLPSSDETEQAVLAFRQRLAFASSRAYTPHRWSIENKAPRSSSSDLAVSESQPSLTTETPPSLEGLGIQNFSTHNNVNNRYPPGDMFPEETQEGAQVECDSINTRHPRSLYDLIFGSSMLQRKCPSSSTHGVRSSLSSSSSHQYEGLEQSQFESNPQYISAAPTFHFNRSSAVDHKYHGLAGSNDNKMGLEEVPITPPKKAWPPSQAYSFPSRNLSTVPPSQAASPKGENLKSSTPHSFRTPQAIHTPNHQRGRSIGGSVLPNGHPASSLAKDLGIATGGIRTPRSRQTSALGIKCTNTHRATDTTLRDFADGPVNDTHPLSGFVLMHNVEEPILANHASSGSDDRNAAVQPKLRSVEVSRQRVGMEFEENNEAAAHSLLDLAASPSPLDHASKATFPGHTPSLQDDLIPGRRRIHMEENMSPRPVKYRRIMDDIERHHENADVRSFKQMSPPGSLVSHRRTSSLGSNQVLQASLQPTTPTRSRHKHHKSEVGRVKLMSPPMTPPRSTHTCDEKRESWTSHNRTEAKASPDTPSRPEKYIEYQKNSDVHHDNDGTEATHLKKCLTSKADEDLAATPKTPPPIHSAPRTPKAPGSNFSYGDFLHVSPSPQPRSRTYSHNDMSSAAHLQEKDTTPMLVALAETPTRSLRSRARFLDFSESDKDGSDREGRAKIPSDKASFDTSDFERSLDYRNLDSVAVGDEQHILVPGRRATSLNCVDAKEAAVL